MPDGSYQSPNHHKYTYSNRLYQWHLQAFLRRLNRMLTETDPRLVLDAGCGEGFVTSYLARQHPNLLLTGVDLSAEAIAYADQHYGNLARFRRGDLYKLPFSDDAFDTIVCSEVLEHLDDPAGAVRELKRVARRYVLITVPREPYFKWLNDAGRRLGVTPDPGHVNFWTKASFQTFIRHHFEEVDFAWKHVYQLALAKA